MLYNIPDYLSKNDYKYKTIQPKYFALLKKIIDLYKSYVLSFKHRTNGSPL